MGPLINLPFDRDRQHLPAEDRQQIAGGEKTKPARPKCSVGIMSRRRGNNRACNFRPLADWRIVFVRHARALAYAHEIVSSCEPVATVRESCLGSARASLAGDRAFAIANFSIEFYYNMFSARRRKRHARRARSPERRRRTYRVGSRGNFA